MRSRSCAAPRQASSTARISTSTAACRLSGRKHLLENSNPSSRRQAVMASVIRRRRCRLCDGARLEQALPIAASPIADAYVSRERLGERQETYPLDLYLCLDCGHVQNVDVVDPEILFRDYTYATSGPRGWWSTTGATRTR